MSLFEGKFPNAVFLQNKESDFYEYLNEDRAEFKARFRLIRDYCRAMWNPFFTPSRYIIPFYRRGDQIFFAVVQFTKQYDIYFSETEFKEIEKFFVNEGFKKEVRPVARPEFQEMITFGFEASYKNIIKE